MKIAITLEYDGSAFAGWQLQPGQRTVQGEMEKALHCYLRALARQNAIELYVLPHLTASGRTDAGVHALGQTASFSWPAEIPCDLKRLKAALNGLTPRAICLKRVEQRGDQFDARRSPHIKCYTYEIVLERTKGAVAEKRAWCVGVPLRVPQMISAARVFAGAHDFSSFRASDCDASSAVRTVVLSELCRADSDRLVYTIVGRSFLKQMVRTIVGTLVEVGRGRLEPDDMARILQCASRRTAGPTAPAHGLYLRWVKYEADDM